MGSETGERHHPEPPAGLVRYRLAFRAKTVTNGRHDGAGVALDHAFIQSGEDGRKSFPEIVSICLWPYSQEEEPYLGRCDIRFGDGTFLMVTSDKPYDVAKTERDKAYVQFVHELHGPPGRREPGTDRVPGRHAARKDGRGRHHRLLLALWANRILATQCRVFSRFAVVAWPWHACVGGLRPRRLGRVAARTQTICAGSLATHGAAVAPRRSHPTQEVAADGRCNRGLCAALLAYLGVASTRGRSWDPCRWKLAT